MTQPLFVEGSVEGIPNATIASTTTSPPPQVSASGEQQFFTAKDLEQARRQEKDKLYPTIEELQARIRTWETQEAERQAEVERQRQEAAEAARKAAEEELSVRELLEQRTKEWQAQLAAEKAAREQSDALLAQERAYQDLMQYRSERVEAVRDQIIPTLLDLVSGNTADEIEASIADLTTRSNAILADAAQASQQARQNMAGSRVTSPAAGPLDTYTGQQTAQLDVASMTMDEYAKHRHQLLGGNSTRGRGLFG